MWTQQGDVARATLLSAYFLAKVSLLNKPTANTHGGSRDKNDTLEKDMERAREIWGRARAGTVAMIKQRVPSPPLTPARATPPFPPPSSPVPQSPGSQTLSSSQSRI